MADTLQRECLAYGRYLTGQPPDAYVQQTYRDAIDRVPAVQTPGGRFERLLLALSRMALLTRAVDAYARFFRPRSMVRRRLVLLFAILESSGRTAAPFERADGGGLPMFILRAGLSGLWVLSLLSLSAVVLLPLQLLLGGEEAR